MVHQLWGWVDRVFLFHLDVLLFIISCELVRNRAASSNLGYLLIQVLQFRGIDLIGRRDLYFEGRLEIVIGEDSRQSEWQYNEEL